MNENAAEFRARIVAAIAELPEQQRIAMSLVHEEALSGPEIAAAMGLTEEQVDALLLQAIGSIRRALGITNGAPHDFPQGLRPT